MLNYGVGIAFHDVEASDVNNATKIGERFPIVQDSIIKRLSGRGCKMLAEPNGNKTYITAAMDYTPIQTMVAQAGTITLSPYQTTDDLHKKLLGRVFNDDPNYFKSFIINELKLPKEKRKAIHIGVHNTNANWANLLLWINNTYGKDGDDSVWFPSQEEYYEYNYYRTHGTHTLIKIDNNTLKLTVTMPSGQYFYYPSVTINVKGLKWENIASITTDGVVTGLSYGNYDDGIMLNIDCRKYLVEHATHYVELYEKNKTNQTIQADAIYFAKKLKDSEKKTALLNRTK